MQLYITSSLPCSVLVCSDNAFTAGTDRTVFSINNTCHFVTLFPILRGSSIIPLTVKLNPFDELWQGYGNSYPINVFPEDKFADVFFSHETNKAHDPSLYCIYDWGKGKYEIYCNFKPSVSNICNPSRLASINFPRKGGQRRIVELFNDCGLRLNVAEGQPRQERSYCICGNEYGWTKGTMRLLDIGREQLLIIHTFADEWEMIIAVNGEFNIVATIEGESCKIDGGYLSSITGLGTVMGHERRVRYDFHNGRLEKLPDDIGFFAHTRNNPVSEKEIALALVEAVMLEREDEVNMLLGTQLLDQLSFSDLKDFFGDFDECMLAPVGFETKDSCIIIGTAQKRGTEIQPVKKYLFTVENGLVTDVTDDDSL